MLCFSILPLHFTLYFVSTTFAVFFRFADILLSVDIAVPGRTGTVCSQGVAYSAREDQCMRYRGLQVGCQVAKCKFKVMIAKETM